MAGFLKSLEAAIPSHNRRIALLEERERRRQGEAAEATGALGKGVVPHVPVREEFLVEVKSSSGGGVWNARRLMLDGSNNWIDDDEDTADYACLAGPGSSPFVGCVCWARLEHLRADDTPVYILTLGEALGFEATIDDAVDGNYKYAWTQVDALAGTTALDETTGTLGRAFNRASVGFNPSITDRRTIPVGTRVWMRWNSGTGRMEFTLYPEPNTEAC